MSFQLLKFLHFSGILLVFLSFGALIARAMLSPENLKLRRFAGLCSGIGLLILLVSGLLLLGQLSGPKGWIIIKLGVWVGLGAALVWINRKPQQACLAWWMVLGLGAIAAFAAIFKPF